MRARPGDLVVGRWGARFLGRRLPCAIGRGGLKRVKREGDGATPVGAFRLAGGFWRADRRARPIAPAVALRPAGPRDLWSDDPADPAYNRHVSAFAHPWSAERLRRADRLYDIVLSTDHNADPPAPGAGSAIFVHLWRGPRVPTAGCVAFRRRDLEWILARWRRESRLIVQS